MKNRTLQIHGISEFYGPAYCEAQGLSKVFQAYADHCVNDCIMDGGIGFNENSGYVYIALENGVSICSMLGNDVEYLVTNYDNGEEHFFNTYDEAITFDIHHDLNFENED
jgi:hypothetical protein